jgi:hypothetical protein
MMLIRIIVYNKTEYHLFFFFFLYSLAQHKRKTKVGSGII